MAVRVTLNNGFPREATRHMQERMLLIGEEVADRARSLCPVDSGRLRNSIVAVRSIDGVTIGSDLAYAGIVEYGSSRRYAHPYLRPALDSLKVTPPSLA